jgi:NADP-dependent alcohol dehydrogenase
MQKFSFQNKTRIHFGQDQIQKIAKEIPTTARVLMMFGGGSIKSNGVYDQVVKSLEGHTWFEFSGVEPNPRYDTLMKALPIIKENKIDYILAVGGGSVVDGAKFIAAASLFEGDDPWDILAKQAPIKTALPVGAILTLPATGSESNGNSVVTRDGNKLPFSSPLVCPEFAVLDPSVTLSLSDRQISNGVVDAFVHVMEQYLTDNVNAKVQDRFSEGLLLTLIEEGPKALASDSRTDMDVRANIMWSATMALNGLIGVGVPQDWSTHMIGHELTGLYGIDHARSLSIILPSVMEVRKATKRTKLLQYAQRVWNITQGTEDEIISQAIANTKTFFKQMEVPTSLTDVDLGEAEIDVIISKLEAHGMTALGEDSAITLDISRQILQKAL